MKLRLAAALALGLSLVGGPGQAQMMEGPGTYGPYLRAEGGWNHMKNLEFNSSNSGSSASTTEGEGYIAGGALGYGFGIFRVELNIDYRSNDVNSISTGGLAGSAGGTIQGTTYMLNGLMDLPFNWMGITPYIGAGIGAVHLKAASLSVGATTLVNSSDNVAAVQGMAGLRYNLTPNWGLGLEYRFLEGLHPNFQSERVGATAAQGFATNDYRNHSILLSVTYSFGAPPPPAPAPMPAAAPAPAPAPQPAPVAGARQLFLVFFDFDKSNITDAGRQVLDAAAAAVKRDRAVRIELTGYTDTVGTQQYNLGLSKRRADAVRDYLIKQGIPDNRMNVAWKGKEDLRVPTPDGVREPQNRRVEIVIP
jgi:outer membrane protein OmpA-like peptidoglycan-associated protein